MVAWKALTWNGFYATVPAGEAVGEPLVVEAEQVQDGGVEVVDVDRLVRHGRAELVGRAVDQARLDAAAGEPGRKDGRVMAPAAWAVLPGRPAELRRPDD